MSLFVASVIAVLVISAICSLSEAAIYAVRLPYVRKISEAGNRSGLILADFKENIERPIAAILIINTAANTAGAAVAGAQARLLFGETALIWFSLLFTLAVLFLSEIGPKVAGVIHNRPIATLVARPWSIAIRVLYPMIWMIQKISTIFKPPESAIAPEEEVHHFAKMSAEEGSIMQHEADMVSNVLELDRVTVRDLMTPRPVVFKLPSDMTIREVSQKVREWNHTRVPIYEASDPEIWKGFVLSRDVLTAQARDDFDARLDALCRPLVFVSEKTPGHVLLRSFLKQRTHLFGVIDGYGDITGIVTLEDVVESLLGEEIVDEADATVDMQALARRRRQERFGKIDDSEGAGTRNDGVDSPQE